MAHTNWTGKRALELLKGAALWRAFLDARGDAPSAKAHNAFERWREGFAARHNAPHNAIMSAIENITATAYRESQYVSARSQEL
jgi:hypothetical protein